MWCVKCKRDIGGCVCLDLDERLAALRKPGSLVALTWCRNCDKLAARCRCDVPDHAVEMPWRAKSPSAARAGGGAVSGKPEGVR